MLVLHVYPSAPEPWVLDAIGADRIAPVRIQSLSRPDLALARLAGGGVSAILLDVTGGGGAPDLSSLDLLRLHANDRPILIAASSAAQVAAGKERVITASDAALLPALLREAAAMSRSQKVIVSPRAADSRVIGFLGVKGGVGATTAALNIATLLAQAKDVALAELRADLGELARRLKSATRQGSLETFLERPDAIDTQAIQEALWTVDSVPRLRVLSAPAKAGDSASLGAALAAKLISGLRACAPTVILDLCWSEREALRAAVFEVSQLVLVAERTPFCMDLLRDIATQLFTWGVSRNVMCCFVINRSPAGVPPPIAQLESQLDISVLGYLPPDADVCGRSEALRKPIVTILPDGLITQSYEALIRNLESRLDRRPAQPARFS
jgi:Flp pilus assembly CpaE family ATPase